MRREPVSSAAITSVGYDAAHAVLEIEFTGGDVYRYYAVPPSVHAALMGAPSLGRCFQHSIRDRYPTERL
ncbi:KTSC domain-containing protein [Microbacterium sp.]|uniref:KTSC domain-containing protein n=1 Tax=Microbacterium sp. TaxID=51671 RepID=UPI002811EF6E|nr:KTSC domain-containing protein [Microbacterium sp.]